MSNSQKKVLVPKDYKMFVAHHGETLCNKKGLYTGLVNVELDDDGIIQANTIAEFLSSQEINCVYSSPLCRALRTAEIITSRHGGRYITEHHSLLPWSIPEFWLESKETYTEGLKKYVDNPNRRPEYGETLAEFRERTADFLEEKIKPDCKTLLVCHTSNIIAMSEFIEGKRHEKAVVGPGGLLGIYEDGDGYGYDVLLGKTQDADYGQ